MHFERSSQPLLPRKLWYQRVLRSLMIAGLFIGLSLSVGILGYHYFGGLAWVDALLESSMILGGMGPVAPMTNDTVKVFASVYALYSGLVLVATTGVLLAPWLHRMIHKFHAAEDK